MNIRWLCFEREGGVFTGSSSVEAYPGGEPMVKSAPEHPVSRMLMRPKSMLDLMGGLFFADALEERGLTRGLELVLPFVPGARQDRLNDEGDFLFTAKSVAKEINGRAFDKVWVVDPHSDVVSALIDRCKAVRAADCWDKQGRFRTPYSAVVSPDAGAEKRAWGVAKKMGVPLLHGWKTRNVATGEISEFGCETWYSGNRVLVVDDICDGGGTFVGLGKVLKGRGVKADLYVTHGIFSKGTDDLKKYYEKIFCTDSVESAGSHVGVTVLEVCEGLLVGGL